MGHGKKSSKTQSSSSKSATHYALDAITNGPADQYQTQYSSNAEAGRVYTRMYRDGGSYYDYGTPEAGRQLTYYDKDGNLLENNYGGVSAEKYQRQLRAARKSKRGGGKKGKK